MSELATMTMRVRTRWWAKVLLRLGPVPLSLLYRIAPRLQLRLMRWIVSKLGSRALIIDMVEGR